MTRCPEHGDTCWRVAPNMTIKPESKRITAVWLRLVGEHVEVLIETDGLWQTIIRERADGCYSHIKEL